jgi:cell volume regulation protein A
VNAHQFLVFLGVLLLLAFLAEEVSRRWRFPSVLVLLGIGLLVGPVLDWFRAESFLEAAPHFGAMAFLLIVFEGGLDLELKSVLLGLAPGTKLAFAFFTLSLLAGAGVALAFGAALPVAIAAGIVVAPISGAIVPRSPGRRGFGRSFAL